MKHSSDSMHKGVILSIKPQYYERIRRGQKTVELRRRFPQLVVGTVALVYASAPLSAIVGVLVVSEVLRTSPNELWDLVHERAGISRDEFDRYYVGADEANGLVVADVRPSRPISLAELKSIWPSFCPPQSFRYVALKHSDSGYLFGPPTGSDWIAEINTCV